MKLKVPTIEGVIRRLILVNYRVDPEVMQARVPAPFRVKTFRGYAIAGICLIRLERMTPRLGPNRFGLGSESAAHRVAVEWDTVDGTAEGVFVPRRDTDSLLESVVGGRLFPGRQHRASFDVEEDGHRIRFEMRSADRAVTVRISGCPATRLPPGSLFRTVDEASRFFEKGAVGYSEGRTPRRFEGMRLETKEWAVHPLDVKDVQSSWFDDRGRFPEGSVEFDHALLMRNIQHAWHPLSELAGNRV